MKEKITWRYLEFAFIFIVLPLIHGLRLVNLHNLGMLIIVTIGCMVLLFLDPSFRLPQKSVLNTSGRRYTRLILLRALGVFFVTVVLALALVPEQLFHLPRERWSLWLLIMVIYPVLSALPQEVVFRVFFFHRYKSLFAGHTILASTLAFSFTHIIYENPLALLLTLAGGFLFSMTFRDTKSLLIVSIEHTVYGLIIFTVGLGGYFIN